MKYIKYILFGFVFGVVLVKSEVISWFRIQEMFRFQSFHMYGIIGSAIAVGLISVQIIKIFGLKSSNGEKINTLGKPLLWKANLFGGTIFGLGWALAGSCPAPIYALIGQGAFIYVFVLIGALAGTILYGALRNKLPH